MNDDDDSNARTHVCIFRRYVLEPLATARTKVELERTKVEAERGAFEAFAEAITDVTPPPDGPNERRSRGPSRAPLLDRPPGESVDYLDAFRNTVMSVSHFDAEYDETVEETLETEFGPGIAQLVRLGAGKQRLPGYEEIIVDAATGAAYERIQFCNGLTSDLESIRAATESVTALLDDLDDVLVPAWDRDRLDAELAAIVRRRQADLSRAVSHAGVDGYELCEYLYEDEPWRYPVLTSVARLRSSVTVRDE